MRHNTGWRGAPEHLPWRKTSPIKDQRGAASRHNTGWPLPSCFGKARLYVGAIVAPPDYCDVDISVIPVPPDACVGDLLTNGDRCHAAFMLRLRNGTLSWSPAISVGEMHYFMPFPEFAGAPWGYWDTEELGWLKTGQPVSLTTLRMYNSVSWIGEFLLETIGTGNTVPIAWIMLTDDTIRYGDNLGSHSGPVPRSLNGTASEACVHKLGIRNYIA